MRLNKQAIGIDKPQEQVDPESGSEDGVEVRLSYKSGAWLVVGSF
jgi:hypothetical protein